MLLWSLDFGVPCVARTDSGARSNGQPGRDRDGCHQANARLQRSFRHTSDWNCESGKVLSIDMML
jgi:hypothetical protein